MFLIILNKWNTIPSHLIDEDWQLNPTRAAKKTHTCDVIFSLKCSILTTIGSCTTRSMMVCVCLLWQRLRLWFLPIATSNHLLSASSAQKFWVRIKVQAVALYECVRLLPHFRCLTYNPDIFFSACVWQNTGQSVTTCEWKLRALKRDGNSVGPVHRLELISPEWTNRCVTFSALQRL